MKYTHEFRFMARDEARHVEFLSRYAEISTQEIDHFRIMAKIAKMTNNTSKMKTAFQYLIKAYCTKAGINLRISNLPNYATRRDDVIDKVTAASIHDTMAQFGNVYDAVVFANVGYVWFHEKKHAEYTHNLINNMMIENNIIRTRVF